MEIESGFGDNLRKRLVCCFYRCSWYSVTKTEPRQQRIHEVISYIKTHKKSILQVDTFCSTAVYYKYTLIYTYEHFTNMEWQTVVLYYIYHSNSGEEDRCWLSGWFFCYKQEDMWKALLVILITFYNRVFVSFFVDDCWQFFQRGIDLLPDSWAFEFDWSNRQKFSFNWTNEVNISGLVFASSTECENRSKCCTRFWCSTVATANASETKKFVKAAIISKCSRVP